MRGKITWSVVVIICSAIIASGIYLGLRYSQSQPTPQPDVEIMAEELSRALEGISKEDITKELMEKLNDVPLKYTSLSDGFAVYFPSTPQQNTIENVMDGTVKNYQSVYPSGQLHLFSHADFCIIAARGEQWQRQKRIQAEQRIGRNIFHNGLRVA